MVKSEGNKRMAMETWPKVAIIVLNWNGWRDTIKCLESLQQITYPNYQIVVVDNGSTDDSVERLKAAYPDLSLIVTHKNLGYAGGNNIGIRYALEQGADYVLILNNDTIVEPNVLTVMVDVAKKTGASVVGALIKDMSTKKLLFAKSNYPAMLFYSEPQKRVPNERYWFSDRVEGSAMLLARDLLLKRERTCGYFLDDSLFLYCEEIELALWCRQNNKKSVIAGEAIVYHKVGSSSGGRARPIQFYYLTRNRVLLARRYLHGPLKVCFFAFYPIWKITRAGLYVAKGQFGIAKAILQGLLDGFKGKAGAKDDRATSA